MSTGVQILLIISLTVIILTGLILWVALKIARMNEKREEDFWRKEWERIRKEEDTGER